MWAGSIEKFGEEEEEEEIPKRLKGRPSPLPCLGALL
jgi:hypothetical protein